MNITATVVGRIMSDYEMLEAQLSWICHKYAKAAGFFLAQNWRLESFGYADNTFAVRMSMYYCGSIDYEDISVPLEWLNIDDSQLHDVIEARLAEIRAAREVERLAEEAKDRERRLAEYKKLQAEFGPQSDS